MGTDVSAPNVAPKVEVGPTTVAGYGAALVGAIGFILVQFVNVDQDEAALIATAVFTVVSFVVTQVGRYAQARELAKKPPVVVAPAPELKALPTGRALAAAEWSDPDRPVYERQSELSDDEVTEIVGPETVEDPATEAGGDEAPPPQIH